MTDYAKTTFCAWMVAICLFVLAAIMLAGVVMNVPAVASLSPEELSTMSSMVSADEIDRAIVFHDAHHAEFYQDASGNAAWFIVDRDGVVLSRIDLR